MLPAPDEFEELDPSEAGFAERAIVRMVKSAYGDHRDWPAIREWATSIARDLAVVPAGAR